MHATVRKDRAEAVRNDVDAVESCETLLDFPARVPTADEIDLCSIRTSIGLHDRPYNIRILGRSQLQTVLTTTDIRLCPATRQHEQHSDRSTYSPLLCETRTKRYKSPAHAQKREPVCRTNFAQHNVTWNLEDEVRDEEDEQSNGIPVADVEAKLLIHARNACGRYLCRSVSREDGIERSSCVSVR